MAWETVDDGMGCIHCFTKEVYRKTWVTGKRLYLVRRTDVLTPMSYCECLLEQKGLHEIDMKPLVCVWSVVCVCVVFVLLSKWFMEWHMVFLYNASWTQHPGTGVMQWVMRGNKPCCSCTWSKSFHVIWFWVWCVLSHKVHLYWYCNKWWLCSL